MVPPDGLRLLPQVPRSKIGPSFQTTARSSVDPESGSITPFSDRPVICPLALMEPALLKVSAAGESAPRSVKTPFCNLNAWKMNGSKPSRPPQPKGLQVAGAGTDVAADPTVVPSELRAGKALTGELM